VKKPEGIKPWSVNRREFLELTLASSLVPSVVTSRGRTPQQPINGGGTTWMNEQPLVFSQPWQLPLYAHRTGGFPVWQDESWEFAFTEKAAQEMKAVGITACVVSCFEGYGIEAERSLVEKARQAAAIWHRYGIKVGGYVGSTLHYETLFVEKPDAQEWLVPDYFGRPAIYAQRPDRRWPYFMHPGFREYTKRALKIAIEEVKVDLFLFDHTSMQAEPKMFFHPLAIEDFRNYLRTKYTAQELVPWLGTSDLRHVVPPKFDWPQSAIEDRMFQEWMDFRCEMLARYYEEMATFIHGLNPAVGILTNPHLGLCGVNVAWDGGVDYPRLIPHMQAAWSEEGNYPDVTAEGILVSEIRTFLMASILGARTATYTGIPYVGLIPDEKHMKLQMAQSMAYSRQCLGDVGSVDSLHKLPEGSRKYIQYFHNKFDLYRDVESAAEVAVLHSYASLAYNNDRPYQSTWLFEQALLQSQIPFDIVFDEHLKDLSKYRVLVLADQECIDEKQCDLIRLFVQGGGGVVATEFTSLFTNRHVRRPDFQLADLFKVKAPEFVLWVDDQPLAISPVRNQVGPGRVIYVAEVKPAIVKPSGKPMTSEYWKLPVNRDELVDAVRWASSGRLTLEVHGAPLTVTVNLLRQRSSGALQVHCVNFDIGGNPEVENIKVSVRLPEGKSAPQVRVHSPDQSETQSITPVIRDGTLECELPRLQFYSLLEIR
jgi:hypothetical protein